MSYVLIGGTAVGTVLMLALLPALYAIWFRVSQEALQKGMEEKCREFTEKGSELYGKA